MSFLFGSRSSETTIPEWLQRPTEEMLGRSIDMGKTGYMPYAGPQVAAFDPAQVAAMQNNSQAANAFGMQNAMPRIPNATDYGNGTWGYSSMPLYERQQQWTADNRPGQQSFYDSFFVDPKTGSAGDRMGPVPTKQEILAGLSQPDYGGAGDQGYGAGADGPQGGGIGGYSGFGDMFNGGGPGQSGSTYGGAAGGVSNAAGLSPNEGIGGFFGGLW